MFRKHKVLKITSLIVIAGAIAFLYFGNRTAHAPSTTNTSTQPTQTSEPTKPSYDTTTASSLQVIVNKQHPLSPIDYAPVSTLSVGNGQQMRTEAAQAFLQMQQAAAAAGAPITATSGYRSYSYQKTVYNGYVASYGVAKTDTFSARPGYSEHQTGLAIDIQGEGCVLDNCFANTAQGKWLAGNAYKYGFLLRYPADKVSVTGYQHEAWHYRYIGTELATDMHTKDITTLEEYFDVTGGTSY